MSDTLKHALGTIFAGALAFGLISAAAVLSPAAAPAASEQHSDSQSSEEETGTMDQTSGLTGDLALDLPGRWQAPDPANQNAYVEFTALGTWFASDGCNRAGSSWSVDADGAFDGGGPVAMTMIACDNVPIPQAVSDAKHVAITDDGELLLTAEDGAETTLVRTRDDGIVLEGRWVGPSSATALATVDFNDDGTLLVVAHCTEYSGTWQLEPSTAAAAGQGALSIGEAEVQRTCGDDEPEAALPLRPGSEYRFDFGPEGTFTVTGSGDDAPSVTFYRVERPQYFIASGSSTASAPTPTAE